MPVFRQLDGNASLTCITPQASESSLQNYARFLEQIGNLDAEAAQHCIPGTFSGPPLSEPQRPSPVLVTGKCLIPIVREPRRNHCSSWSKRGREPSLLSGSAATLMKLEVIAGYSSRCSQQTSKRSPSFGERLSQRTRWQVIRRSSFDLGLKGFVHSHLCLVPGCPCATVLSHEREHECTAHLAFVFFHQLGGHKHCALWLPLGCHDTRDFAALEVEK